MDLGEMLEKSEVIKLKNDYDKKPEALKYKAVSDSELKE